MPTNCQFVFKRTTAAYYNGEQIIGHVCLTTTKRLSLEAITITLAGTVRTEWNEHCRYPLNEYIDIKSTDNQITYHGTEEYLKETVQLAEHITLVPGPMHVYYFHFTVPEHVPATCRYRYGEVAYVLSFVLHRATTFNDVHQKTVVIKNRLDLNDEEMKLHEPHCVRNTDRNSGSDLSEFSLPCTGFVPGQLITYQLKFAHILKQQDVVVNLCQRQVYRSQQPMPQTKTNKTIIASSKNMAAHILTFVRNGYLTIPLGTQITTNNMSCLLQVSYYLEAVVTNVRQKILQKLITPITIGTVPLKSLTTGGELMHKFCYDNLGSTVVDWRDVMKINGHFPHKRSLYSHAASMPKNLPHISDRISLIPLKEKQHCNDIGEHYV